MLDACLPVVKTQTVRRHALPRRAGALQVAVSPWFCWKSQRCVRGKARTCTDGSASLDRHSTLNIPSRANGDAQEEFPILLVHSAATYAEPCMREGLYAQHLVQFAWHVHPHDFPLGECVCATPPLVHEQLSAEQLSDEVNELTYPLNPLVLARHSPSENP